MATYSSILAWKIPWTDEPDGLQYMELIKGEIARCLQRHNRTTEHTHALSGLTPRNLEREGNLGSIFADHGFLDSSHPCPTCQQRICVVACTNFMTFGSHPYSHLLFIYSSLFISFIAVFNFTGEEMKHHLIRVHAPVKEWVSELNLNINPHILDPRVCASPSCLCSY